MTPLPVLEPREVERLLERLGLVLFRQIARDVGSTPDELLAAGR